MNNFDTQPLLSEINNIIKNGVQEIVKDFMKRHVLLERTHDTLVNLPSIKEYYNSDKSKDDSIEEIRHEIRIEKEPEPEPESLTEVQDNIKEDVSKLIQNLDEKMNNIWNIHGEYFVKLSNQLDELKKEIDTLKHENKQASTFSNSNVEKENIKLEIVDDKQIEEEVVQEIEELEEQQEEEEEEEEVEEEEVEEEEEEEEVFYIKKNKPKPYNGDMPVVRETLDRTLYKSSTEQLHMRAVEERIKHNLTSCYSALMPREY